MSKKFDALEMKKELLVMKAELQRMEFGGHVDAMKKEFAWVNVFRRFNHWFGRRQMSTLGPLANLMGGQVLREGMKSYPLLGVLASTILVQFRGPISRVMGRASVGAFVLAIGAAFWLRRKNGHAEDEHFYSPELSPAPFPRSEPYEPSKANTLVIDPNAP